MTLKLLIPVLCNAALAVILYLAEKKTTFGRLGRRLKQCMIGVLFGALAVFSTEYGVDVGGAVMNVRDASPLCAGLIFGAPAGIIAGVIGGAYRWFAVFWGAGEYTRLACSVSTVLAGFIVALLRKYMFDDKKPSFIYGLGVGMVCEVLHMLMIFLTNMNDASRAFTFVQSCTLPMVLANGIAVGIAVDEIYSNIINYSGAELATVSYEIKDGKLYMTFRDDGIPYDPLEAEEPDVTLPAEKRKIGGLGIFMVKKMTERMEYAYEDDKNVLRLVICLG